MHLVIEIRLCAIATIRALAYNICISTIFVTVSDAITVIILLFILAAYICGCLWSSSVT